MLLYIYLVIFARKNKSLIIFCCLPRFLLIDLEEQSVSDVLRSVVVSYALSGVTTTAALGKLPYTFRLVFDTLEFSYHVFEVDLCKMLELDLKANKNQNGNQTR